MTLLDRARAELRRRAAPPRQPLAYLRRDELLELRAALVGGPVDYATVARFEKRVAIRRRIGLPPFFDPTAEPGERYTKHDLMRDSCLRTGAWRGDCGCIDEALDSGRHIATERGLRYHAANIHERRNQPVVASPEPQEEPERAARRPLARVLLFRRRKDAPSAPTEAPPAPTKRDSPVLDPALTARVPLETVEELARRIGVPLMPVVSEEDR